MIKVENDVVIIEGNAVDVQTELVAAILSMKELIQDTLPGLTEGELEKHMRFLCELGIVPSEKRKARDKSDMMDATMFAAERFIDNASRS